MAEDKEASTLDDVRAAYESLETPAEAPAATPEVGEAEPGESAEQTGTRARNPDGTFAAKDEPKEPKRPRRGQ